MFSNLWNLLFQQEKEIKLAVVGLDGSGKTTIISKLVDSTFDSQTAPTIGIDTKEIQIRNINVKIFDLAGQESMRNVWKYYFSSTEGVIFVVDASNKDRLADVKEEIWGIFNDNQAKQIPMLVYANKQDLPGALKTSEIMEELSMYDV